MKSIELIDKLGNKVCGIVSIPERASSVVILSHGFTSSKESNTYVDLEKELNNLGIGTIRYDYYGHGKCYGYGPEYAVSRDITLTKTLASIQAIIDHAQKLGDYDTLLLGSSFGGLVSLVAATKNQKIKALVLKSPVTEPISFWESRVGSEGIKKWESEGVLNYNEPPEAFDLDREFWDDLQSYSTLAEARNIKCPVLIVHGDADIVVDLDQSYKLAEKLKDVKIEIIKGAGHSYDEPEHYEECKKAMVKFIKEILN